MGSVWRNKILWYSNGWGDRQNRFVLSITKLTV